MSSTTRLTAATPLNPHHHHPTAEGHPLAPVFPLAASPAPGRYHPPAEGHPLPPLSAAFASASPGLPRPPAEGDSLLPLRPSAAPATALATASTSLGVHPNREVTWRQKTAATRAVASGAGGGFALGRRCENRADLRCFGVLVGQGKIRSRDPTAQAACFSGASHSLPVETLACHAHAGEAVTKCRCSRTRRFLIVAPQTYAVQHRM